MRKYPHFMIDKYGTITETFDVMFWARWLEETKDRFIQQDENKEYFISTIFLGLDHDFGMTGKPLLFETAVFSRIVADDTDKTLEMVRHETLKQAKRFHKKMVKKYIGM